MLTTLSPAGAPDLIDQLLGFGGRLHPLLLHLPIGGLVALAVCELWALLRGRPLERSVRILLATLVCLNAAGTAGAGWLLASEPSYGASSTLTWHRWLGVAVAGLAALTLLAVLAKKSRVYLGLLGVTLVVIGPAGHFGAVLTHGPGYLTAPFRAERPARTPLAPVVVAPPGNDAEANTKAGGIDSRIAKIFANHCVSCHGENRQRGGLAMHTAEALFAGGDYGPAIVPGDPDASEIVIRMRLPLDDEWHMPPESRPQPTGAEIDAVIRWIAEGAGVATP